MIGLKRNSKDNGSKHSFGMEEDRAREGDLLEISLIKSCTDDYGMLRIDKPKEKPREKERKHSSGVDI